MDIIGNSKGLLYLATYLVIMGLSKKRMTGLHIHLSPLVNEVDPDSPEISIYNLDFDPYIQ